MLSINTNLASLIAQRSMKESTNKLDQSIERMTTGAKINHAKDNAANYSIATNMTTKLGALQVAEDNCAMGLDMLATANGTLDQIHDKLQRLRDLAVQASNGTYGEQSLKTISKEAGALVEEINRLYSTAKYNGIALFDSTQGAGCDVESLPEVGPSGFINEVQKRDTSAMTTLASVDPAVALTGGTYSISTPEELAKLATMTNSGLVGESCEFVLGADIDLSGYANWTPIGYAYGAHPFTGTFDGNGYTISNLSITSFSGLYAGLFGVTGKGTIVKNVLITDSSIIAGRVDGGLIGRAVKTQIDNSGVKNTEISSENTAGGLVGTLFYNSSITNSYSDNVEVVSDSNVGGLVGANEGVISDCLSNSTVKGGTVGGFCGLNLGFINNCSSSAQITGGSQVGGFVGQNSTRSFGDPMLENNAGVIQNCNASGNIIINYNNSYGNSRVGGLVGAMVESTLKKCSTTCTITDNVGNATISSIANNQTGTNVITEVFITGCTYNGNNTNTTNQFQGDLSLIRCSNNFDISAISPDVNLDFQVGISANESSMINLTTSFKLSGVYELSSIGLKNEDYLSKIDNLLATVSAKQVEYGATENRLNSALEEISTQYENLLSSRSTIQDADIAEVSSEYIRQQILQQASATLMSTANQSASIALSLI